MHDRSGLHRATPQAGSPTRISDNGGFLGTRNEDKAELSGTPWGTSPDPAASASASASAAPGGAGGRDSVDDPQRHVPPCRPSRAGRL